MRRPNVRQQRRGLSPIFAGLVAFFLLAPVLGSGAAAVGSVAARPAATAAAPLGTGAISPAPDGEQPPGQAPTLSGLYLLNGGTVVAALGYAGFGGIWNGVGGNGSRIFSDGLWVLLWGTTANTEQVSLTLREAGQPTESQEVVVAPSPAEEAVDLATAENPAWERVTVTLQGDIWTGYVAVPVSLLPVTSLNLGGVDLLVMAALSEAVIGFSLAVWAARASMRRAGFAPPFRMIVWGHVFLGTTFLFVLIDYQFVEQTFAGWSPLVYVFPLIGMWYLTSLSLFDRSAKREVLQPTEIKSDLGFRRYLLRVIPTPDGREAYAKESWGQYWARFWRAYVYTKGPQTNSPDPWVATVENLPSPTGSGFGRRRSPVLRALYPTTNPEARKDRFAVVNKQDDDVDGLMLLKAGPPLAIRWPKLTIWRTVAATEAVANRITGEIVEPAKPERRRLTRPHYSFEGVRAEQPAYEGVHARVGMAAVLDWVSKMDLSRMYGEVQASYHTLRSEFDTRVRAQVEADLAAYFAHIGRTWADVSSDEAEGEAQGAAPVRPLRSRGSGA